MLAIVIPFYKLVFFEDTLRSLAEQTNKQFKVYIGDDASPDDCKLLLQKYDEKFNFNYKRFETNLGGTSLTQQWERCIDLIDDPSIEWLMILGDDDMLGNNVVEEFYNNIEEVKENKINVIRLSLVKIDENSSKITEPYQHPKIELSTDFIVRRRKTSLSEYIYNKKQLSKINFKNFPSALFSDIVALLEVSNYSNVFSINTAKVFVRISNINLSGHSIEINNHFSAEKKYYLHLLENIKYFNKDQRVFIYNRINNQIVKNFRKDILFIVKINAYYLKISYKNFLILNKKLIQSIK